MRIFAAAEGTGTSNQSPGGSEGSGSSIEEHIEVEESIEEEICVVESDEDHVCDSNPTCRYCTTSLTKNIMKLKLVAPTCHSYTLQQSLI